MALISGLPFVWPKVHSIRSIQSPTTKYRFNQAIRHLQPLICYSNVIHRLDGGCARNYGEEMEEYL